MNQEYCPDPVRTIRAATVRRDADRRRRADEGPEGRRPSWRGLGGPLARLFLDTWRFAINERRLRPRDLAVWSVDLIEPRDVQPAGSA